MRVMVTGHRPPKVGGYRTPNPTEQWVRSSLRTVLKGLQTRHEDLSAVTGMALGADTIFAEVCLELDIPYTAAVPFKGQESRWPEESQIRYWTLLKQAERIVIVDEIPAYHSDHFGGKLHCRNKWMIDHSDMTVAVWDGSDGGTSYTVKGSQRRRGRKILRVDPRNRTVGIIPPEPEFIPVLDLFGE